MTAAAPAAPRVTTWAGRAGFGPVSAAGTLLAARDGSGRLGTAELPTGPPAHRAGTGAAVSSSAEPPASATDAAGNTSVAAVALDGRLHWSGRDSSGWQPVGTNAR